MPDSIEHRLASLASAAAAAGQLQSPAEIRRRSAARQRRRNGALVLAAVLGVGGVGVGSAVLGSDAAPPVQPAPPVPSVKPSTPPTTTPPTTTPPTTTPPTTTPPTATSKGRPGRIPGPNRRVTLSAPINGRLQMLTVTDDGRVDMSESAPSARTLLVIGSWTAGTPNGADSNLKTAELVDGLPRCLAGTAAGRLVLDDCDARRSEQHFRVSSVAPPNAGESATGDQPTTVTISSDRGAVRLVDGTVTIGEGPATAFAVTDRGRYESPFDAGA